MNAKAMLAAFAASAVVGGAAWGANTQKEAQQLDSAKVSMTDAIRRAEREANGKAVSVDYKAGHKGEEGAYAVKVLTMDNSKLVGYRIDAATGKIVSAGNEPVEKVFTRVKPEEIASAQTSLNSAIDEAQRESGGKATYAAVERNNDHVRYEVKLAKDDGSMSKVLIDGATGHLASAK
jgi:uncharacterized membrane protein YkoI